MVNAQIAAHERQDRRIVNARIGMVNAEIGIMNAGIGTVNTTTGGTAAG